MWMHISNLFSKFKNFIQWAKKIMSYRRKEAEFQYLSFCFQVLVFFFLVHAVSSLLLTMLLLLIYTQYQI